MRRFCERPGCGGAASVSYGIDNDQLIVWIDSAPAVDPARAGTLCRRHADALSVPKGWRIDDRRQPVPMLFPARDITPAQGQRVPPSSDNASGRRSRSRQQTSEVRAGETLFDHAPIPVESSHVAIPDESQELATLSNEDIHKAEAEVETDAEVVVEEIVDEPVLEETQAIPWTPRLISSGNDDTASIKKGRLLGRAFGDRNQKTADE